MYHSSIHTTVTAEQTGPRPIGGRSSRTNPRERFPRAASTARTALAALAFLAAALLPFSAPRAAAGPLPVSVSIPPQKYFIEKIGGPDVAVTVLADKGRDPHTYEPTASQMAQVGKAAVYFAVGVPFETRWLPRFQALNKTMAVVRLQDGVTRLRGKPDLALRESGWRDVHGHEHEHGLETDDPHLWLSPHAVKQFIPLIADALSRAVPEKEAAFRARAAAFAAEIDALDSRIAALFAPLPPDRRTFLTFHQGWAYFASNYNLHEASVELEGKEPGPRGMAALFAFAEKKKITAVVADPLSPKSTVAAIAGQIKARIIDAAPLDENWPDALQRFAAKLAPALANAPADLPAR